MTRIAFMVPGRPKGKGRARTPRGGGRPYTPKATVAAEREIAVEFKIARNALANATGNPIPLMTGTVALSIEAVFRIPKGWSKADRAAAVAGELEYTGKPDRDNIEKLVKDALNGVAWLDDAQVNRGPALVRRYGSPERIEVVVEEVAATGRKSPAERRREAKAATGTVDASRVKKRAKARSTACELPAIGRRIR